MRGRAYRGEESPSPCGDRGARCHQGIPARREARAAEGHARIRDAKRRESQAAAKIRKAENARRAAIKAAKEARPMSANKRRYLEDKKK